MLVQNKWNDNKKNQVKTSYNPLKFKWVEEKNSHSAYFIFFPISVLGSMESIKLKIKFLLPNVKPCHTSMLWFFSSCAFSAIYYKHVYWWSYNLIMLTCTLFTISNVLLWITKLVQYSVFAVVLDLTLLSMHLDVKQTICYKVSTV